MQTVTVGGAHDQTVTLHYDTAANATLARQIATAISAAGKTISAAVDTDGSPPTPLPPDTIGEFVQTQDGVWSLPSGYKVFVDTAQNSVVFGSGDADESVLSSIGNMSFIATGGSGTVVAGGGDNRIVIPRSDSGDWSINTGHGNDFVLALGSGNDTINPGGGHNAIVLGSGKTWMQSTGDDTVIGGSGQETITAFPGQGVDPLIYGGASQLYYIGTAGSGGATVYGGTGSDTFFGGSGPDLVHGGTAGNNFLVAGSGSATLFGGGDGDQLFASGDQPQALHAGAGNETLFGAFGSGADTFYGGTGATSIIGGQGNDTFVFAKGQAGSETIAGFASGQDTVDLQGYTEHQLKNALKHAEVTDGSTTIKLPDHTTITFVGVSDLMASDFVITGTGDTGNGSGKDDDDTGARGHGRHDEMDDSHIRSIVTGHSDH